MARTLRTRVPPGSRRRNQPCCTDPRTRPVRAAAATGVSTPAACRRDGLCTGTGFWPVRVLVHDSRSLARVPREEDLASRSQSASDSEDAAATLSALRSSSPFGPITMGHASHALRAGSHHREEKPGGSHLSTPPRSGMSGQGARVRDVDHSGAENHHEHGGEDAEHQETPS